jgi:hypothetical protein
MCLTNCIPCVKELLKSKVKTFKFYKVVSLEKNKLYSLLHHKNKWHAGVNLSTSKRQKPSLKSIDVARGIHVFRSFASAKEEKNCWNDRTTVILEVLCDKANLLGANSLRAVFKKVRVSRRAYKLARQR